MNEELLALIKDKKGFICDMDGVIYHGNRLLPGVKEFVNWLYAEDKNFLFLTNSSERSPIELKEKLARLGLEIDESHFYTSALATAKFLKDQSPGCSAYALYDVEITMNDVDPDYVVFGETRSYNYESVMRAVKLIQKGAKLIATNPDLTGPTEEGIVPACRALVAPIELATGKEAYYVGKPNPLMMRTGIKRLGVHSDDALIIGDRMDTDIIAGIESGLTTFLVLSGVSTRETVKDFPYRPNYILTGIDEIVAGLGLQ